ncbi:MAG: ABC transporter substrate-binding protein [Bacillota bacterium]
MLFRKWLTVLTAAVLVLGFVPACGTGTAGTRPAPATAPQQEPKVELRAIWWGSQDRHDKTLRAIEAFQRKYPHITIHSEFSDFSTHWDKLLVKTASGDAPDLIQMDFAYINEYAGRGALLDLTPYTGKELNLADVDKNLIESGKVGDRLYGIALGSNTMALHVNKTLLDQAGLPVPAFDWTWKDLERYAAEVKVKLGQDFWFTPDQSAERNTLEYWVRQRGKSGLWKGYELNVTEEDVAGWWRFWDDLRKAGLVPSGEVSVANGSFGGAFEASLWARNKGTVHWGWSNEYERNARVVKGETVMVPYPRGEKADGHYAKVSMYWSVYSKTKYPEEAALFIRWFISDPEAARILSTTRGVPVTATARDALKQAGLSPYDRAMFDFVEKVTKIAGPTPAPAPKGNTEVVKLFVRLTEEQAFGRKSPEEAAREFMTEATRILQKANAQ